MYFCARIIAMWVIVATAIATATKSTIITKIAGAPQFATSFTISGYIKYTLRITFKPFTQLSSYNLLGKDLSYKHLKCSDPLSFIV